MKEKWTSHIIAVMALVVFIVLGLASATTGSTPDVPPPDLGVYDKSVSEDQLVTLEIAGGLKVIGFNGTEVSWGENGSVPSEAKTAWRAMRWGNTFKTIIKIPAGNHTLQANFYLWDYNEYPGTVRGAAYVRANGLEISHDFQPGHTYFLRPVINGEATIGQKYEVLEYTNTVGWIYNSKGSRAQVILTALKQLSVRLRIDENGSPVAQR